MSAIPPPFAFVSDLTHVERMLRNWSLSKVETAYYECSFTELQQALLFNLMHYARSRDSKDLIQVLHAILAYSVFTFEPLKNDIPSLVSNYFFSKIVETSVIVDKEFALEFERFKHNGSTVLRCRQEEWQVILAVTARLISSTAQEPLLPYFFTALSEYKQQVIPTCTQFAFSICRLADIFYAWWPDQDAFALSSVRLMLMDGHCKAQPDTMLQFHLFQSLYEIDLSLPTALNNSRERSLNVLTQSELDYVANIVIRRDFEKEKREEFLKICKDPGMPINVQNLGEFVKTAVVLHNVPLRDLLERDFLAEDFFDEYLESLESVLVAQGKINFSSFSVRDKQANVLFLLAYSLLVPNKDSLIILLCAFPYCLNYLDGICFKELYACIASANPDNDTISSATHSVIINFLNNDTNAIQVQRSQRPATLSMLARLMGSQFAEALVLIPDVLIKWKVAANPQPESIAGVIRSFAQLVVREGSYEYEERLRQTAYTLFECLMADDEIRVSQHRINAKTIDDELLMIKVLFRLLECDQKFPTPLDGRDPNWTMQLEGQELELFVELANSSRAKKISKKVLFQYYMDNGAIKLAIQILPSLSLMQAVKLLDLIQQRGSNEELLEFLSVTHDATFPDTLLVGLFLHLISKNDFASLLVASQIVANEMVVEMLEVLLVTLEQLMSAPNPSITKLLLAQSVLRSLLEATWVKDVTVSYKCTEDKNCKTFINRIVNLAKLCDIEDITTAICNKKVDAMFLKYFLLTKAEAKGNNSRKPTLRARVHILNARKYAGQESLLT